MFRHITVFAVSFLSFLTMFIPKTASAAQHQGRNKAPKDISVSYQPMASPGGVVFAVVKRDRILRRELANSGTTLYFVPVTKGKDTIQQLKKSQVVFATMGDMPLLEATDIVPLKIIAQLKNNYAMVVGERGTTPNALKGKRIGNAFATTGHFALLKALASVGLTEKDVNLVTMEVNEMPEALRNGKIDAFAAWEPTASSTIAQNPDRYAAIGRQASAAYLVSSLPFAEQNPAVVRYVAASVIRAMRWLQLSKTNVDRAAEWNFADIMALTGKTPTMSFQEIARYSHDDLNALHYTPKMSRRIATGNSLLAEEHNFLKKLGKVSPTAQWASISKNFDFAVLEQILSKPVKYSLEQFDYEE